MCNRFVTQLLAGIAVLGLVAPAIAADATVPGEVTTPYPTLTNLAVEWAIQGDDNLNAAVTVRYRAAGEESWRQAMPLRRVPAGQSEQTRPIFSWDNKLSGSTQMVKFRARTEISSRGRCSFARLAFNMVFDLSPWMLYR